MLGAGGAKRGETQPPAPQRLRRQACNSTPAMGFDQHTTKVYSTEKGRDLGFKVPGRDASAPSPLAKKQPDSKENMKQKHRTLIFKETRRHLWPQTAARKHEEQMEGW